MPRYAFQCQACGETFDIDASVSGCASMQKYRSIVCPRCGAKKVVRMFTAPTVVTRSSRIARSGGCGPACRCG